MASIPARAPHTRRYFRKTFRWDYFGTSLPVQSTRVANTTHISTFDILIQMPTSSAFATGWSTLRSSFHHHHFLLPTLLHGRPLHPQHRPPRTLRCCSSKHSFPLGLLVHFSLLLVSSTGAGEPGKLQTWPVLHHSYPQNLFSSQPRPLPRNEKIDKLLADGTSDGVTHSVPTYGCVFAGSSGTAVDVIAPVARSSVHGPRACTACKAPYSIC